MVSDTALTAARSVAVGGEVKLKPCGQKPAFCFRCCAIHGRQAERVCLSRGVESFAAL